MFRETQCSLLSYVSMANECFMTTYYSRTMLFLLFVSVKFCFSQTVSYNDVAVIINDNSTVSDQIGTYFKLKRNIPEQNMIHVSAPNTEQIDSLEFEQIRVQVESYLINNNLVDSINYIVTTKGVPLKIDAGCVTDSLPESRCASVDSELALILGPYAGSIGQNSSIQNPMYESHANFSRDSMGIYLVTRLDGYTKSDVFNLIDRSGPDTGLNKESATAVVDISNATGWETSFFVSRFMPAYDALLAQSWNAQIDSLFAPLMNQQNVFSYLSMAHGPLPYYPMNYEFVPGSFGTLTMCGSAYTFDQTTNVENSVLVADMIAYGATGMHGYVDFVFMGQVMRPEILVDRYLDATNNFNLAESFYMGEMVLSWQSVFIGDPKASVKVDNLAQLNSSMSVNSLEIFPNPGSGLINIHSEEPINKVAIHDMHGELVYEKEKGQEKSVQLNLTQFKEGVYIVQVETTTTSILERFVIK